MSRKKGTISTGNRIDAWEEAQRLRGTCDRLREQRDSARRERDEIKKGAEKARGLRRELKAVMDSNSALGAELDRKQEEVWECNRQLDRLRSLTEEKDRTVKILRWLVVGLTALIMALVILLASSTSTASERPLSPIVHASVYSPDPGCVYGHLEALGARYTASVVLCGDGSGWWRVSRVEDGVRYSWARQGVLVDP